MDDQANMACRMLDVIDAFGNGRITYEEAKLVTSEASEYPDVRDRALDAIEGIQSWRVNCA